MIEFKKRIKDLLRQLTKTKNRRKGNRYPSNSTANFKALVNNLFFDQCLFSDPRFNNLLLKSLKVFCRMRLISGDYVSMKCVDFLVTFQYRIY